MTTLTSPHDLLVAIPFLIGYHPTNSLVLVSLKDECVGMAMRIDYPDTLDSGALHDHCQGLVSHLVHEGAQGALVIAYVPEGRRDGEEMLNAIATHLSGADIYLRESLLISAGRWRSVLCGDLQCCPPQGNALPKIQSSRIAVEQVAQGRPMPYADLAGLADSIAALPLASDEQFNKQVRACAIDPDAAGLLALQKNGALSVIDLASRFIAGSVDSDIDLDQRISAQVLGALADIQVRDFALGSHDGATLEIYSAMWRYLLRIAPAGFVAPVACLLAGISYEQGAGSLAHRCLDRALLDEPAYSLAALLRRVFSAGWPPESFASMRKDLHLRVCAGIFEN